MAVQSEAMNLMDEECGKTDPRHCEERSDEAIQIASGLNVWIASRTLAMTE